MSLPGRLAALEGKKKKKANLSQYSQSIPGQGRSAAMGMKLPLGRDSDYSSMDCIMSFSLSEHIDTPSGMEAAI